MGEVAVTMTKHEKGICATCQSPLRFPGIAYRYDGEHIKNLQGSQSLRD